MEKTNKILMISLLFLLVLGLANAAVPFESLAQQEADNPTAPFSDISQESQNKVPFEDLVQNNEQGQQAPFGNIADPEDSTPVSIDSGQETQPSFSWLYVAFPLILVAGLLAYVEVKRKKGHVELTNESRRNKMDSLKSYVEGNLKKGYNKGQISDALAKNNYNSREIEEAFKGLR